MKLRSGLKCMESTLLQHDLPFDPTYGYDEEALLGVGAPPEADDLADFWHRAYAEAMNVELNLDRRRIDSGDPNLDLYEIEFDSLGGVRIGGWMTVPRSGRIERGVVISHGYGGRAEPALTVPGPRAATIQPCARGFHRSAHPDLPDNAAEHVVHGIRCRGTYIHLGCVADHWCAASALIELLPEVGKRLDYHGGSFGGGIGAMTLAWDQRFHRAALKVPSFGNHPLRVTLPCKGSGASVRQYYCRHPEVLDVLRYFDAAVMARRITIPVHFACARFDPSVPPPGQFAVHNAMAGEKGLFILTSGHFAHPDEPAEQAALCDAQSAWFS